MVASSLAGAVFLYLLIALIVADKRKGSGYARSFWFFALGGFGTALGVAYLYNLVWPDLASAGAGLLFALIVVWAIRKKSSLGMRFALFLILWIAAVVGGTLEGWETERNYSQNFLQQRKLTEIQQKTDLKRAVRDSIDQINSRSRDSLIAISWAPHKKIRYEDSFNPADESYQHLLIERNSVTGEYRVAELRNSADTLFSKRHELLKEIAEGMERHWRAPIDRDSIFVVTADGDWQFVGIDSEADRRQSGLRAVCNTKVLANSPEGRFVYTEYEACLRTARIEKRPYISMELCGTSTALLYRDINRLFEFPRPPACVDSAVQSP